MKKILKQCVAWATGLRSNLFAWARIKLTALYLLIIVATLVVYSTAMYFSLLRHVRGEAGIDHLQLQIGIIDVITFIVAAVGSYWLAGATLRPIKKALDAQEAFSADASHELRTPLAVMKTEIEVLLRSKETFSPEVTKTLNSTLEEIGTLTTMTTDLLELSRGRQARNEQVALPAVIQNEVETLQALARAKHIDLACTLAGPATVRGNAERLGRAFKNVIANAITYTPEQGRVTVALRVAHHQTIVTISDNGIGISEHDLPQVFTRFYKADAARAAHGSGLGLAIAKQIVEQYQGTIAIQSEQGKGTTVTITLPISM